MCSYDSTCDHLPLADMCPKEATHPQFEAFVISRKLDKDSISLSTPPPPPRRVRPPFYRLSDLSVQYKNRGSYPLSSPVSEGHENVFDPSSQLPRNV